jgi:hypothetical protein
VPHEKLLFILIGPLTQIPKVVTFVWAPAKIFENRLFSFCALMRAPFDPRLSQSVERSLAQRVTYHIPPLTPAGFVESELERERNREVCMAVVHVHSSPALMP